MIWSIYGHIIFKCIRRIQNRKQPYRRFCSISLLIDNKKKSVHCKQSSKKRPYILKKCRKMSFLDILQRLQQGKMVHGLGIYCKIQCSQAVNSYFSATSLARLGLLMFKSDRCDSILQLFLLLMSLPEKRAASTSWFDLSQRSRISEI